MGYLNDSPGYLYNLTVRGTLTGNYLNLGANSNPDIRAYITGLTSTTATWSLLAVNAAGQTALRVQDNLTVVAANGAATFATTGATLTGTTQVAALTASGLATLNGGVTSTDQITSTMVNANMAVPYRAIGASTGAKTLYFENTGGNASFGVEKSTGSYVVNGSTGYDAILNGSTGVSIGVNNSLVGRFSSTGLAVPGAISATGGSKFGAGAWPSVSVGQSGSRGAFLSDTESGYLLVGDMQAGVAANRGGELWLGARATTATDNFAITKVRGYRTTASSGDKTTAVSITTSDAAGTLTDVATFSSTGLAVPGAVSATTTILSSGATSGIGYTTGAGGTVTQATSKSTGVTLNKVTGRITMNGEALASGAVASFTLTNSAIAAGDIIMMNYAGGSAAFGSYHYDAASAAGSATIVVRNLTAGSLSEALVLGFVVIKGATA